MNLTGIISIAGMPGLYKAVAQTKNGLIVESLIEKKRIPTYANHKISSLEEISVYTTGEDRPLKEVFKQLAEKLTAEVTIEHKAPESEIKSVFDNAVPDYDKERVHLSDLRKIIQWFNILQKNGLLTEAPQNKEEEGNVPKMPVTAEEKPKTFTKGVKKDTKAKPTKSPAAKKTQTTRKSGAA